MSVHPILIGGAWRPSQSEETFQAENPATGKTLGERFPVSPWADLDAALGAAGAAAEAMRASAPEERAKFLEAYAARIEALAEPLVKAANEETALPVAPRLQAIELPRTTGQLRQAAAAARDGSWALPTIDAKNNIRSMHAAIGPALIFGPNNFPFAFNAVSGGDFAAAIAAGNPVVAKAHPCHPNTTRLLAEAALEALAETALPRAAVQLLYHLAPESGLRAAGDPRLAALAFTGSRRAGLALKAAADAAGKPAFLEMSSVNPVVMLPGALAEQGEAIADAYADSALAASGQFCTNPGIVFLCEGPGADAFIAAVKSRFESRKPGPLLSRGVLDALGASVGKLLDAGATLACGGAPLPGPAFAFANTLMTVDAGRFLGNPESLQAEAFGNASLFVVAKDVAQIAEALGRLEGNLTASLYSGAGGQDDAACRELAPLLRAKAGRLLNDKMPTGVAVSPAMNHGGPYPATGHAGFTAVGFPASLRRFSRLECYDNVRGDRLPAILRNENPGGRAFRLTDGEWTRANVA
jgi:NADP-dependent aldehyde dehydrogenase